MPDQNNSQIVGFTGIQQVPYHIHNGLDAPQLPFSSISTYQVSTDGTMAADSQTLIPTQSAVVTYVNARTSPGGNGTDGALNISSGTTTLSCGGLPVLIKNYTSISITATAKLNFTGAHAGGTTVILLSQGNITISSNTPGIDLTGIGGTGGNAGNGGAPGTNGSSSTEYAAIIDGFVHSGQFGGGAVTTTAGTGGAAPIGFTLQYRGMLTGPGQGGGGGGGGSNGASSNGAGGGAGGTGGGTLILESGGNISITGTINLSGQNGANGAGTGDGIHGAGTQGGSGGGGGGGASGSFIATYVGTYANTGTIILSAGSGEAGGTITTGGSGGAGNPGAGGGGGSGGASVTNPGVAGNTGGSIGTSGTTIGGTGGNGASGISLVNQLI